MLKLIQRFERRGFFSVLSVGESFSSDSLITLYHRDLAGRSGSNHDGKTISLRKEMHCSLNCSAQLIAGTTATGKEC